MQQMFQTTKRLIARLLVTMLLVTAAMTISPTPARADESNATSRNICGGIFVSGCDSKGDRGVVINKQTSSPNQDLTRANLQGKNLTEANFSGANLSQAKLNGANLSGVDLSGATLTGVNLKGANLSGVNWSEVKLSKQDLVALIQTNMTGGGWFQAVPILGKQDLLQIIEPDFYQVVLTGDNLSEANLSGSNLSKANFIGANFKDAKLGGVDLTGADLTGAKMPNGKIYKP